MSDQEESETFPAILDQELEKLDPSDSPRKTVAVKPQDISNLSLVPEGAVIKDIKTKVTSAQKLKPTPINIGYDAGGKKAIVGSTSNSLDKNL